MSGAGSGEIALKPTLSKAAGAQVRGLIREGSRLKSMQTVRLPAPPVEPEVKILQRLHAAARAPLAGVK